jgi:cyclic-di-AMP phosphodiesterase PgpH
MKARELLAPLSRAPGQLWPDAVIHHGARVLLLALLAVATTMLFPVAPLADLPVLERGMVAEEDVIAEVPFAIYRPEAELARARQDAAAAERPIFVYHAAAVDTMLAAVDGFFLSVDSVIGHADSEADARQALRDLLTVSALPPSAQNVGLLADAAQRQRLRRGVRDVILDELPRGIALSSDLDDADSREIRLIAHERDRIIPRDSVLTSGDLFSRSRLHVPPVAPQGYEQLQRLLLVRYLTPSIRPDWTATEQERARARAAVDVVRGHVLQGERIVTARERVGDAEIERLRAYQQELERRGELGGEGRRGMRTAGQFLFNVIILSLLGALLFFYRLEVYREIRHLVVLGSLVLALVGAGAVIANYGVSVALIPIAFPALVVAALWDGRLAINLSLVTAILLSGQAPFLGITALLTLVTVGAVASLSVRVVRRRAQTWGFIVLITAAYVLAAVVLALLRGWTLPEVLMASGLGGASAMASAFAAMGFIPLLEGYTRITTDQTLLELADANRPLLRRLSREAPGTYAHSINVANLAESAAAAIGANALLTRVGVYYHDVGKMGRPLYFIENQPSGRNPHDKLKPAMSAAVVRNHVIDGLKLAEEEKLPEAVKAFIAEHHGTQAISFFYDQAREADPDAELDLRDFCYPGPIPQSKETAILMLADSVESAARVLPDPTPDKIRELVDRITQGKIDAGQLDDAPLTMRELTAVKAELSSVLSGMYHHRIDYPSGRTRTDQGTRSTPAPATGASDGGALAETSKAGPDPKQSDGTRAGAGAEAGSAEAKAQAEADARAEEEARAGAR